MEDALEQLAALADRVRGCERCTTLLDHRVRALPGGGHPHAAVLVGGACPSEADEAGATQAGAGLLDELAEYMPALAGPHRGHVYATTLLKCVPRSGTDVRAPREDEQAACFEYLSREISITTPHHILAVGEPTARYLLKRLFRDLPYRQGDALELRVFENPAFSVVPVATPQDLRERDEKQRKAYRERLHALAQRLRL